MAPALYVPLLYVFFTCSKNRWYTTLDNHIKKIFQCYSSWVRSVTLPVFSKNISLFTWKGWRWIKYINNHSQESIERELREYKHRLSWMTSQNTWMQVCNCQLSILPCKGLSHYIVIGTHVPFLNSNYSWKHIRSLRDCKNIFSNGCPFDSLKKCTLNLYFIFFMLTFILFIMFFAFNVISIYFVIFFFKWRMNYLLKNNYLGAFNVIWIICIIHNTWYFS